MCLYYPLLKMFVKFFWTMFCKNQLVLEASESKKDVAANKDNCILRVAKCETASLTEFSLNNKYSDLLLVLLFYKPIGYIGA